MFVFYKFNVWRGNHVKGKNKCDCNKKYGKCKNNQIRLYYNDSDFFHYRETTKSQEEVDAKRLLKTREGEISDGKLPGIYFDRVPYIPMLEENNVRKGFFEHAEFVSLRDALPSYLKGFVTFAYKTGWRVSEITGLTWNQVDLDNGIVRLEPGETKNDEGRTIYLDDELQKVFNHQWENRKRNRKLIPYVFPNIDATDRINDFR